MSPDGSLLLSLLIIFGESRRDPDIKEMRAAFK
jgi:hypothetical protein